MSNTQISELRKGDRLRDERGRSFTVQSDARPEMPARTRGETFQVMLVSDSGALAIRLTYRDPGEWRKI